MGAAENRVRFPRPSVPRSPVAGVGLAGAGAAVAVVVAGTAVELVWAGASVEAVVAGAAVAAVFTRAHDADVVAGAAPAAVAAGAVVAVVVARAADAVAVAGAGDADVVVGTADAAVASRAFGITDVPLGIADELVRAAAEVDDQRERHAIGRFDEVARGTHVDLDLRDVPGRADREPVPALEVAPERTVVGHIAGDNDLVSARAEGQARPRLGAVDDDLAGWRGKRGGRQQGDRHKQTDQEPAAGA